MIEGSWEIMSGIGDCSPSGVCFCEFSPDRLLTPRVNCRRSNGEGSIVPVPANVLADLNLSILSGANGVVNELYCSGDANTDFVEDDTV